jgi:hypothetical protein
MLLELALSDRFAFDAHATLACFAFRLNSSIKPQLTFMYGGPYASDEPEKHER